MLHEEIFLRQVSRHEILQIKRNFRPGQSPGNLRSTVSCESGSNQHLSAAPHTQLDRRFADHDI